MTHSFQPDAELLSLINSACSDTITAEQIEQLEKILRTNQRGVPVVPPIPHAGK